MCPHPGVGVTGGAVVADGAGALVVIEGLDGAGKRTLAEGLRRALRAEGRSVATLAFPRYGQSVTADLAHEARGARWLAPLLPASVTGPIALHVAAKRYRCAVDAEYHGSLSAGSVRSLVRQGGPMDDDERTRFERNPAHRDAVRLRGWDDAGKDLDAVVPDLAS